MEPQVELLSDHEQVKALFCRLVDCLKAHLERDGSPGYSKVWDSPVSQGVLKD